MSWVSLDRSLTIRQHATKPAVKIKSRNNLIAILAGKSWGVSAQIFDSLLSSRVTEYCVPAWGRSSHVKMVDRQLNKTMHAHRLRHYSSNCTPVASSFIPHCSSSRQRYQSHHQVYQLHSNETRAFLNNFLRFLARDSIYAVVRYRLCYRPSVRPSVCPVSVCQTDGSVKNGSS